MCEVCMHTRSMNLNSEKRKGRFPLLYFAAAGEKLRQQTIFLGSFAAEETCAAPPVAENFNFFFTFF